MARGADTDTVDDVVDDPVVDDTTDDTSDHLPTIQEAFAAAKAEHSKEQAPGTEVSTGVTAKTGDTAARDTKAVVAPTDTATPDTKPSDSTSLLTDEEFSTLQTKYATDPSGLRKALEGAFTKKTQALAEERRTATRFAPYADFIDAYEEDPEATVIALAKQQGLTITRPGETTTETTPETTTTAVDAVLGEFKEALGPELEYLADGLVPAITKLVERLTASTVDKATEPLKAQTKGLLDRAAVEQTETVMKAFGETHPDWKEHEDAMLALSQQLSPNGIRHVEYLGHLYKLVTADAKAAASEKDVEAKVAERVKAAIAKMTKGAETTETKQDATPERQVRARIPALPTFQEAFEAAKRGEVWTD